ncbi:uncharacterized protein LOC131860218 [Cryptomeria japonica]|uniref:uncharacterized protein LOC131860218 n=1 Tax=Cryptomeria japonica TaxID=3369 RepID=UPI0027DA55D0|nr:uncharacterized protein LOC131860218 [Cryptomeria japonica]
MEFITGLPKAQGRDCIYVVVDRLTKFAHFFPISTTYTAAQELFRLSGTELTPSTSYHPQTDGQTKIVNKWMTPFMALYGYEAPNFLYLLLGDSKVPKAKDVLQESQDILKTLKENIQKAQNQQKQYANQHRVEHSFEVGDMVYLMLQPYRQSMLRKSGAEKLKPRYYGSFKII